MENNVICLIKGKTPKDLISFKDFACKYNMKKGYLYKLYSAGKFKRYKRGVWKISESEVLNVLERVI